MNLSHNEKTTPLLEANGLKVRFVKGLWWVIRTKGGRVACEVCPGREPIYTTSDKAIEAASKYVPKENP